MKKSFIVLFLVMTLICTLLALPVSAATPQKATQSDGTEVDGITIAYGTPTVDGDIDAAWANATGYKTANQFHGDKDATVTTEWKFMWDEDRFYALCVVTDANLITAVPTPPTGNQHDSVNWTLCFGDFTSDDYVGYDLDNVSLHNSWEGQESLADKKDQMFGVVVGDKYAPGVTTGTTYVGYTAVTGEDLAKNYAHAQKKTSTGFVVEFSCDPSAVASDFELKAGAVGGIGAAYRNSSGTTAPALAGIYGLNNAGGNTMDFVNGYKNLVPFTLEAAPAVDDEPSDENPDTGAALLTASIVLVAAAGVVLFKKH